MGEPDSSASITKLSGSSQSQTDNGRCPAEEDQAGHRLHDASLQLTHTTSGSCHHGQQCRPAPVADSALTPLTCKWQEEEEGEAVVAVEGGYLYSPARDLHPLQGVPSAHCTPDTYCGYAASRRCCMMVFLVMFCFLLLVLTILLVIVFVGLKPSSHI